MIINHKNKYIFLELPRTGTTSIRNVLLEKHQGEEVLFRHAPYSLLIKKRREFKNNNYFVFACNRNPMDRVYSLYSKMKLNHNDYFTRLEQSKGRFFNKRYFLKRYYDIQKNGLSFADYFLKYHKAPYSDWMYMDYKYCDFIIDFENLDNDFKLALKKIHVEQNATLPIKNKSNKGESFLSQYSPETIDRAKYVFGIYMQKFNYSFPKEWGDIKISLVQRVHFWILLKIKKVYWLRSKIM